MAAPAHINLYPMFLRPPQVFPSGSAPANIAVTVGGAQIAAAVGGTEIAVAVET